MGWLSRNALSVCPATSHPCWANEAASVRCMVRMSLLRMVISAGGSAFLPSRSVSQAESERTTKTARTQRKIFMRIARMMPMERPSASSPDIRRRTRLALHRLEHDFLALARRVDLQRLSRFRYELLRMRNHAVDFRVVVSGI